MEAPALRLALVRTEAGEKRGSAPWTQQSHRKASLTGNPKCTAFFTECSSRT